jgi:hypothetical protein
MKEQSRTRKHPAWAAAFLGGIFLTAVLLTTCSDFFAPHAIPGKAKNQGPLLDETPFEVTIHMENRDNAGQTANSLAARTIADDTDIFGKGVWNYAQIIVVEDDGKRIVTWDEYRTNGINKDGSLWIGSKRIDMSQKYTFLLLMGHWERDYEDAGPGKEYIYKEAPPTLLAAGYTKVIPGEVPQGGIVITMYPIVMHVNFSGKKSGEGNTISLASTINKNEEIEPVLLELADSGAEWTANWTISRAGLIKLLETEGWTKDTGGFNSLFPDNTREALILAGETDETPARYPLSVDYASGKASLDITDYVKGMTETETGYVNFNLKYLPFFGGGEDPPLPPGSWPGEPVKTGMRPVDHPQRGQRPAPGQ